MKIRFLNGNLLIRKNKSGVHFFHENIIRGLVNTDLEFDTLFFNFFNKNKELLEDKENLWIRDRVIQNKILHRAFLYIFPIEFFVGKSDIYVCDGWMPITIFKSKKIAVVHDLMSKIYPENYKPLMKLYLYVYFKQIRKADKVIAVSQTTKQDIIKYLNINPDKIEVVYNGVDFREIDKILSYDNNIVNERIDYDKKYLFYVGEMRKNKNLILSIKAFEKYYKLTNDDIYFYIAGKKAFEYEELKEYSEKNGLSNRVIFLGYITEQEKMKLFKNAFAFIFISLYEGFGIPILEAMANKAPVITSNCSSMKEIANEAAILVNPIDINSIVEGIKSMNNNEVRKSCILNGEKRVKDFTWKKSIIKFRSLLK